MVHILVTLFRMIALAVLTGSIFRRSPLRRKFIPVETVMLGQQVQRHQSAQPAQYLHSDP